MYDIEIQLDRHLQFTICFFKIHLRYWRTIQTQFRTKHIAPKLFHFSLNVTVAAGNAPPPLQVAPQAPRQRPAYEAGLNMNWSLSKGEDCLLMNSNSSKRVKLQKRLKIMKIIPTSIYNCVSAVFSTNCCISISLIIHNCVMSIPTFTKSSTKLKWRPPGLHQEPVPHAWTQGFQGGEG